MKCKILITMLLFAVLNISCSDSDDPFNENPNVNLNDGLVAHWTFDEEPGLSGRAGRVRDRVNRTFGTLYNGAAVVNEGINGSIAFDGIDDYIQFPDADHRAPAEFDSLGQGSISIWFKANFIPETRTIAPIFSYGNGKTYPGMVASNNEGIIIELGHGDMVPGTKRLYFTQFQEYGSRFPVW